MLTPVPTAILILRIYQYSDHRNTKASFALGRSEESQEKLTTTRRPIFRQRQHTRMPTLRPRHEHRRTNAFVMPVLRAFGLIAKKSIR